MALLVAAPRVSATSNAIDVCNRIPRFVTRELEARGYEVIRSYLGYTFASVHGLKKVDGTWTGAADPNHDGMPIAV